MVVAAAAAIAVAILGGAMTDLGPWYYSLRQPEWKPPDWLFGPAWTLIFALTAVAGYLGWRRAPDRNTREWLWVLFSAKPSERVVDTIFFGCTVRTGHCTRSASFGFDRDAYCSFCVASHLRSLGSLPFISPGSVSRPP